MATTPSKSTQEQESPLSKLNAVIQDLNQTKETTSVALIKSVHGSVCALLTLVRVGFLPVHASRPLANRRQDSVINRADYVELGLVCANVCKALDRGMNGRQGEDLSGSVSQAIEQLTA